MCSCAAAAVKFFWFSISVMPRKMPSYFFCTRKIPLYINCILYHRCNLGTSGAVSAAIYNTTCYVLFSHLKYFRPIDSSNVSFILHLYRYTTTNNVYLLLGRHCLCVTNSFTAVIHLPSEALLCVTNSNDDQIGQHLYIISSLHVCLIVFAYSCIVIGCCHTAAGVCIHRP